LTEKARYYTLSIKRNNIIYYAMITFAVRKLGTNDVCILFVIADLMIVP